MTNTYKEAILILREEGKTYREIAAILNCAVSTVAHHVGPGQREKAAGRNRKKQNIKRRFVQEAKTGKICPDCKNQFPHWVMEFDHVRGTKLQSISRMTQLKEWSLADIQTEIEKCDIVCSNCHKSRTYFRSIRSGDSLYRPEIGTLDEAEKISMLSSKFVD